MTVIDIPFSREMAIAAIDGRKVATTRSEAKGLVGCAFFVEDPRRIGEGGPTTKYGAQFRLIEIMAVDLETVKNLYFRLEGFDSPEAFEKTWRALHRGHFTTGKLYYIHFFGRIA
jgi:hypothetical protein